MDGPLVFLDFDGVLNAFPDGAVMHRGGVGHTDWLADGDPRKPLYDAGHAFALDRRADVRPDGIRYRLRWSSQLADGMIALATSGAVELCWLSTWQPYTGLLNHHLGWPEDAVRTISWYDPFSGYGRMDGKLREVSLAVREQSERAANGKPARPIVWIDDDECHAAARDHIESLRPAAPVLMVRPDWHIGISRPQWARIRDFVAAPPAADAAVTLDDGMGGPAARSGADGGDGADTHHGL